jgi:RNA polymerase-binding transcription factor DksA
MPSPGKTTKKAPAKKAAAKKSVVTKAAAKKVAPKRPVAKTLKRPTKKVAKKPAPKKAPAKKAPAKPVKKAAAEAKKQREIDAKRKAIEAEKQRKIREIERRNQEELKRQERREAEERKRLEALERKMHSKPYADEPEFLEELRQRLLETRAATNDDIVVMESEADEMLVDRERLEYDDEDGSSVASDIQRDQKKDLASLLRLKVDEIDVALARIADGSYGRCDECFEAISKPRLLAQLPVFMCVSCRASV